MKKKKNIQECIKLQQIKGWKNELFAFPLSCSLEASVIKTISFKVEMSFKKHPTQVEIGYSTSPFESQSIRCQLGSNKGQAKKTQS